MKILIIMGGFLFIWIACSGNSYYEKYLELYEVAKSNQDSSAVQNIIKGTRSRDFWDRYYGYGFLGDLALSSDLEFYPNGRAEVVDILVGGLDDEPEIQRIIIEHLIRLGEEGVRPAFDHLVAFVGECREDDVGWFSAEALAVTVSRKHTVQAIEALGNALKCKPLEEQMVPGAPQLRRYAMDSLLVLAADDSVLVEEKCREARAEIEDADFLSEIEKALGEIESP